MIQQCNSPLRTGYYDAQYWTKSPFSQIWKCTCIMGGRMQFAPTMLFSEYPTHHPLIIRFVKYSNLIFPIIPFGIGFGFYFHLVQSQNIIVAIFIAPYNYFCMWRKGLQELNEFLCGYNAFLKRKMVILIIIENIIDLDPSFEIFSCFPKSSSTI